MCGIAGYMSLDGQAVADSTVLRNMCETLYHRGPDSAGEYMDRTLAMGFRRLKIMDPETGDQPMFSPDGNIVLLCNGEIFNHHELKKTIKDPHVKYRSQSDVEVLIYLYLERGMDFVRDLNGQFAFVLYDRGLKRLYMVRDQFGICPLYYTVKNNVLVFASEIKGLLQHPLVDAGLDLSGLDQLLTFPGTVSPRTLFSGINSMESGTSICVDQNGLKTHRYWDLAYPLGEPEARSEQDCLEELEALFSRSVQLRLQSDVPLGCYLSGGLDSSLILSFASRQSAIPAFSIGFEQQAQDESYYQDIIAKHCGSTLQRLAFRYDFSKQAFESMIYHSESALKETYNLCSMALSRETKRNGVSVILSGEGADELFAGYVGYRMNGQGQQRQSGLDSFMEDQYRESLWGDPNCYYERDYYAFEESKQAIYSEQLNQSFEEFNCIHHSPVDQSRLLGRSAVNQRSYLDFKLRLSDHLVADHGDRMAMANSVEVRYPFLDKDLVEFSTRLPVEFKINQGREKYLLRQLAGKELPQSVANRQKFGFHARGCDAILQTQSEWVQDMLSFDRIKRQGVFNPETVEYLKQQYSGEGFELNLPYEDDWLMPVLSLSVFMDVFSIKAV